MGEKLKRIKKIGVPIKEEELEKQLNAETSRKRKGRKMPQSDNYQRNRQFL